MKRRWERDLERGLDEMLKEMAERVRKGHTIRDGLVTQLGTTSNFRDEPRWNAPEIDVSVFQGRASVEQVLRWTYHRPPRPSDAVRVLDAALLWDASYGVLDTGHRGNPHHASIVAGLPRGCSVSEVRQWWSHPSRVKLAEIARKSSPGAAS